MNFWKAAATGGHRSNFGLWVNFRKFITSERNKDLLTDDSESSGCVLCSKIIKVMKWSNFNMKFQVQEQIQAKVELQPNFNLNFNLYNNYGTTKVI